MSPKISLCFFIIPHGKAYRCPFYVYIFLRNKCFCYTRPIGCSYRCLHSVKTVDVWPWKSG